MLTDVSGNVTGGGNLDSSHDFYTMTQVQINALSPVEGMVVFNTDTKKLQIYTENRESFTINNEVFVGSYTREYMDPFVRQTFKATAAGSITAIEFLIKNSPASGSSDFLDMSISGTHVHAIIPDTYSSWTWHTIILDNQIPVNANTSYTMDIHGPGFYRNHWATNSFYADGSSDSFVVRETGEDDILFKIHVVPTSSSLTWVNLN